MSKMIFVNLPVADLPKAMAFYTALGFTNNPHFSDETAACMVRDAAIPVVLPPHAKWGGFTTRSICPPGSSEVALAINFDSRDEVDRIIAAAAAHGGVADINPPEDHGFMYQRSLTDPDGHVWEPFWMDPAAVPPSE